ncbi:NAD(P)H-dependent oxidoreductase [Polaribacter batillariae]|uniref:NAD(P)H-dependent oxidoreductase n=1 Tax=Polaribacter batillariae TaxID=2808900 RepID=A0ABX7SXF8_9FLAO|nr:NAD(P)H-dependent oxidoreductase [Polaribacter batillariae]QTD37514.1 NAD(P)H-dependent oxidoreductase [Polaribacter batillariae]
MKKILAFAGSTSSTSINKKLVTFTAESLEKTAFDIIDLRDFSVPMFSEDEEKENGFPKDITKLSNLLDNYDGFILSLAEHNGSYAAAFKNIFDWCSRINNNVFREKPLLLMATSPGGMGGKFVLAAAEQRFPRHAAKELVTFSLPNFSDNFKEGKIINNEYLALLTQQIEQFENLVHN